MKQINRKFDSMKKSIKSLKESNNHIIHENVKHKETASGLALRVENLETIIQSHYEHTEKTAAQSRRSNLIIYGIKDERNETWKTTETQFREYVDKDLQLDETRIQTEQVHSLKSKEKPSTIIVKFSFIKIETWFLKSTETCVRINENQMLIKMTSLKTEMTPKTWSPLFA